MRKVVSFKKMVSLEKVAQTLANILGNNVGIYPSSFSGLTAVNGDGYIYNKNLPRGKLFQVNSLDSKNALTKKCTYEYEIITLGADFKTSEIYRMKSIINNI
jgi:hypothetical protein